MARRQVKKARKDRLKEKVPRLIVDDKLSVNESYEGEGEVEDEDAVQFNSSPRVIENYIIDGNNGNTGNEVQVGKDGRERKESRDGIDGKVRKDRDNDGNSDVDSTDAAVGGPVAPPVNLVQPLLNLFSFSNFYST